MGRGPQEDAIHGTNVLRLHASMDIILNEFF